MSSNDFGVATVTVDIMTKQMKFSIQKCLEEYLDRQRDALASLVENGIKDTTIAKAISYQLERAVEDNVAKLIREEMNDIIKLIAKKRINRICNEVIKKIKDTMDRGEW